VLGQLDAANGQGTLNTHPAADKGASLKFSFTPDALQGMQRLGLSKPLVEHILQQEAEKGTTPAFAYNFHQYLAYTGQLGSAVNDTVGQWLLAHSYSADGTILTATHVT
jgi:hypothetical protein